jgi:copper resistance protein C
MTINVSLINVSLRYAMRLIIAALLGTTLAVATADGHAALEHASPLAGSTVGEAPQHVVLTFSDKLEPAFSRLAVTDAGGTQVNDGKAQVDGNTMRVGLKTLAPGTYTVNWRAVSADTHATQGRFVFRVEGK